MTAHDYEDMLQVGVITSIFDFLDLTNIIHSVLYLFLKGFCLNHTIYMCSSSYLNWHTGMVLPRSACTQMQLWKFYPVSLDLWEIAYVYLRKRHVWHFRLESWNTSGLLGNDVRKNLQLIVWHPNQEDLQHLTVMHAVKHRS